MDKPAPVEPPEPPAPSRLRAACRDAAIKALVFVALLVVIGGGLIVFSVFVK